jgi:hypothetical protein
MKILFLIILLGIASLGFADGKYVNDTLGFEMSVPGPAGSSPVYTHCIFYLSAQDDFAANVNLQVQEFNGKIEDYKNLSDEQFKQASLKIIQSSTEGEIYAVEYAGKMNQYDLHWFAKAFRHKNKIYLVTATGLEKLWKTQGPILMQSVNSFKVK